MPLLLIFHSGGSMPYMMIAWKLAKIWKVHGIPCHIHDDYRPRIQSSIFFMFKMWCNLEMIAQTSTHFLKHSLNIWQSYILLINVQRNQHHSRHHLFWWFPFEPLEFYTLALSKPRLTFCHHQSNLLSLSLWVKILSHAPVVKKIVLFILMHLLSLRKTINSSG